ncbi:hypothetical protein ACJX0J_010277, partial [Zea mays]
MPQRNILDNVVVLNGVAYDKVKWPFLQQILRMKDIMVNDMDDMFAILIDRAKTAGQVTGVLPHLVDKGLSILQYEDDTILAVWVIVEEKFERKLNSWKAKYLTYGGRFFWQGEQQKKKYRLARWNIMLFNEDSLAIPSFGLGFWGKHASMAEVFYVGSMYDRFVKKLMWMSGAVHLLVQILEQFMGKGGTTEDQGSEWVETMLFIFKEYEDKISLTWVKNPHLITS